MHMEGRISIHTHMHIMRSARAAMTVAGNACAKKDAKSDMI
jgi:hypothetical protein